MRLLGGSNSKGDIEAMGLGRSVGRTTGLQGDYSTLHIFFIYNEREFEAKWL